MWKATFVLFIHYLNLGIAFYANDDFDYMQEETDLMESNARKLELIIDVKEAQLANRNINPVIKARDTLITKKPTNHIDSYYDDDDTVTLSPEEEEELKQSLLQELEDNPILTATFIPGNERPESYVTSHLAPKPILEEMAKIYVGLMFERAEKLGWMVVRNVSVENDELLDV